MKRILFIIVLCTFAFAQVPDSVIVAKIAVIEAEFNRNVDMIRQLQDRQVFLNGQHIAWSDMLLLNKEEVVEEDE